MIDEQRAAFEAWVSTQSVVTKYGAKLHRSSCGNHYKDLRINQRWLAYQAGYQAALASPEVQALRWRPIDTAPMDGSTILIGRFNSHGKWRTMRGQWMGEEYIAENWEDPDDVEPGWFETSVEADDTPNCWRIIEPTHWMPLPAPPIDAAMEKQK